MRFTGLKSGLILDVGCGSGLLMKKLADMGFDVEGVETSENDVAYVMDMFGYKVFYGTLEELKLQECHYDAVMLFYVFEHLLNPTKMMEEVFRILKPGGMIVVAVPMIDSWQARLFRKRWSQVLEAPRHLLIPSSKGMVELLSKTGFKEIKRAPASILDTAGFIALSFFPQASVFLSYGHADKLTLILRRFTGGLLTSLSLPIALGERLFLKIGYASVGGMIFFGRK